jgi:predicted acetyltransferase
MSLNKLELKSITSDQKHILESLMSLYLHDLSEFADDLKVNEEGKFEYEGLELYFKTEDLKPFFIIYQSEVAGFVLLNTGKYTPKDIDYIVHELFLLKGYRKKGLAGATVKKLLDLYKGNYKVVQIASNKPAVSFWKRFYEEQGIQYIESKEVVDELEGIVQTFHV